MTCLSFSIPRDELVAAEIDMLIDALTDAQSRQRIADMWLLGWITGDMAMKCLISMGLIEFSPEAVL